MTLRAPPILTGGQHIGLNIEGWDVDAILCYARHSTLVDLGRALPLTFRREYRQFGGGVFMAACLAIDSLGCDVDVWAGRGLSATVEIGTDLAALLGLIP